MAIEPKEITMQFYNNPPPPKCRWLHWTFDVFAPSASWNAVGGVYVFAGLDSSKCWRALYIGQATDFRSRFSSHEQWAPAVKMGASHVHALVCDQRQRDIVESGLIRHFQPPLNQQLKGWPRQR